MNTNRKFGVELEVSHSKGKSTPGGVFRLKHDSSVSEDGLEFVSPILSGQGGIDAVTALCEYGMAHGWECDESCGYHLHIDMRDLRPRQIRKILLAYLLTQRIWFSMQPQRDGNEFCERLGMTSDDVRHMDFNSLMEYGENCADPWYGRFGWVNTLAYGTHGTIEIRLHAGTIDKDEVVNWIKMHLEFVETVKDLKYDKIHELFGAGNNWQAVADIAGTELAAYYLLPKPVMA